MTEDLTFPGSVTSPWRCCPGFHKVMEGIDKAIEMGYDPIKVPEPHVFDGSLLCFSPSSCSLRLF